MGGNEIQADADITVAPAEPRVLVAPLDHDPRFPLRMTNILTVDIHEAQNIKGMSKSGSDAKCVISYSATKQETSVCKNTTNPKWGQQLSFMFSATDPLLTMRIAVFNYNWIFSDDLLGFADVDLHCLVQNSMIHRELLLGENAGKLLVSFILHCVPLNHSFYVRVDNPTFGTASMWIQDFSKSNLFQFTQGELKDINSQCLLNISESENSYGTEQSHYVFAPGNRQTPVLTVTKASWGLEFTLAGPDLSMLVHGKPLAQSYVFVDPAGTHKASLGVLLPGLLHQVEISSDCKDVLLVLASVIAILKSRKGML